MKNVLTVLILFLSSSACFAETAKLLAHCTVSEVLPNGTSATTVFKFDGSEQEHDYPMSLTTGIKVVLRSSPGSVMNFQAYTVTAIISDSTSGVGNTAQGWFVSKNKYSDKFASVIPGSLMVRLRRPNQELIEVTCFNPQ